LGSFSLSTDCVLILTIKWYMCLILGDFSQTHLVTLAVEETLRKTV
jgi:hypothetical protein